MALLLCHECYSWVQPRRGHCPDCLAQVDINEADPSPLRLQEILGELTVKLGEVTVKRRPLSGAGLLYATTKGLYFLPHQVERIPETYERNGDVGQTLIWTVAGALWAPLYLIMPLLQSRSKDYSAIIYRPQLLTPAQSDLLPELLMENPGAFFIPNVAVRSVRRRWRSWIIERNHGPRLKLRPTTMRGGVDRRMRNLIKTPSWQHVIR